MVPCNIVEKRSEHINIICSAIIGKREVVELNYYLMSCLLLREIVARVGLH